MRKHILESRKQAGISKVVIERPHKKCRVTVHTARPGILIGKKGADIEKLRRELAALHRFRGASQHPRSAQARDRRHSGRRGHRAAARAPRRFPPRHEARRAVGDAHGRARHPHQLRRPARWRRDRAHGVVSRGPRAVAYAARQYRLRHGARRARPTASSASRCGSSRARSWSTIPWPRRTARSRRKKAAARKGAANPPRRRPEA